MSEIVITEDNGKLIAQEIPTAIEKALETIGLIAEGHAIGYETAVKTGNLRNSITHVVDNGEKFVAIGTNVKYAPYIELGHHSYQGLHFLVRAAELHGEEYREILKAALSGE